MPTLLGQKGSSMRTPPMGDSRDSDGDPLGVLPNLFRRKRAIVRYRVHRLNVELHLELPSSFIWQIGGSLHGWDALIADVQEAQKGVVGAIKERYPFLLRAPLLTRQQHVFQRTFVELERAQAMR